MAIKRNGTTTRNVDRWVQELFKNGVVYIYERDKFGHTDWQKSSDALGIFLHRMKSEHTFAFSKLSEGSGMFGGVACFKVIFSGWKGQFDYHKFMAECKIEAQKEKDVE